MKVLLVGYQGKMGDVVRQQAKLDPSLEVYGLGIAKESKVYLRIEEAPKPDLILDFSIPEALNSYLDYALEHRIPLVVATTGYSPDQEARLQAASQVVPLFKSANFSLGVFALNRLLEFALQLLPDMDIDLYDAHHKLKLDAPSGTAKHLLKTITQARPLRVQTNTAEARQKASVYVHIERIGSLVGEHRIVFSDTSEIIELRHSAQSKEVFAKGALKAAQWLVHQPAGFYTMEDLWKTS